MTDSVRERVRKVLVETELSDPHDIADALLAKLKGQAARDALAECLPQYVRIVLSGERRRDRLDPAMGATTNQRSTAGSSRSSKWAAARSLFRQPIYVGQWRQLGELTVEEVTWLVDDRDRQAKELMIARDRWSALRDLMTRRKADRVADLPESEVAEVLQ